MAFRPQLGVNINKVAKITKIMVEGRTFFEKHLKNASGSEVA